MKQLWAQGALDHYLAADRTQHSQQQGVDAGDEQTVDPLLFRNDDGTAATPPPSADLALPSNEMFISHCHYLESKYTLNDCLVKGTVDAVSAADLASTAASPGSSRSSPPRYAVRLQDGRLILCRRVASCVGNLCPRVPQWATDALRSIPCELRPAYQQAIQHTSTLVRQAAATSEGTSRPPQLLSRGSPAAVLIVGGGLTSAQLATLLLKAAHTQTTTNAACAGAFSSRTIASADIDLSCGVHVCLVMRGACRQQQFDLTSPWMGRQRYDMQRDWLSVKVT